MKRHSGYLRSMVTLYHARTCNPWMSLRYTARKNQKEIYFWWTDWEEMGDSFDSCVIAEGIKHIFVGWIWGRWRISPQVSRSRVCCWLNGRSYKLASIIWQINQCWSSAEVWRRYTDRKGTKRGLASRWPSCRYIWWEPNPQFHSLWGIVPRRSISRSCHQYYSGRHAEIGWFGGLVAK